MQKLIYGVGIFLTLLIIIGFALPRTHQVEVPIEIDAHPATVFALLDDLRRHSAWSTWAGTDPKARFHYSGPSRGVGATMTWDGAIIGSGSQRIEVSRAYEHVAIVMNPGESGEARSWFDLQPGVGTTQLVWGFETDHGMNIVGRYFASMLGGVVARDFHQGLVNLKTLAEGLPRADFGGLELEHMTVEASQIAILRTSSSPDPDAVSAALGKAYFQVLTFIDANNLEENGAPISIPQTLGGSTLTLDAAIPVSGVTDSTPRDGRGVKIGQTYAGDIVRASHIGSYRDLSDTSRKVLAYLAARNIRRNGPAWESYVSDPGTVAEDKLLTYLYYPIRAD